MAVASAQEVGDRAGTVFVSLPTPDIVHAVVLDENGVSKGSRVKTVIDLSTIGPGMATRVSTALGDRNIAWLDAPVSGGLAGA